MVESRPSLTVRLTLVIVGLTLLTISAVGLGAYLPARAALRDQIEQHLMSIADGRATLLDQVMGQQVERARELGAPVLVTGSLYLLADLAVRPARVA